MSKIIFYISPNGCLLIALDAHMFNHNGYGPGTTAQGPKAAGPGPGGLQLLGPGPWSRAHMQYGFTDVHQRNQLAINRQCVTLNLAYYMSCS